MEDNRNLSEELLYSVKKTYAGKHLLDEWFRCERCGEVHKIDDPEELKKESLYCDKFKERFPYKERYRFLKNNVFRLEDLPEADRNNVQFIEEDGAIRISLFRIKF